MNWPQRQISQRDFDDSQQNKKNNSNKLIRNKRENQPKLQNKL